MGLFSRNRERRYSLEDGNVPLTAASLARLMAGDEVAAGITVTPEKAAGLTAVWRSVAIPPSTRMVHHELIAREIKDSIDADVVFATTGEEALERLEDEQYSYHDDHHLQADCGKTRYKVVLIIIAWVVQRMGMHFHRICQLEGLLRVHTLHGKSLKNNSSVYG